MIGFGELSSPKTILGLSMKRTLCLFLMLAACGHAKDEPENLPAADAPRARYAAAVSRMLVDFTENDQIVSRHADGSPEHQGDSLLWNWTAIGVLGCGEGYQLLHASLARLSAESGLLYRYLPLPAEYEGGNETSLDPELGFWFGVASRWRRCPDDRAELAEAWQLRQRAIGVAKGRLHPNVPVVIPAGIDAVGDQVGAAMGVGQYPNEARLGLLGAELSAWAAATITSHSACYRLNLAWTSLRALEEAGGALPGRWRDIFCKATTPAGIATVDHWCGRGDLAAFVEGYQFNAWEYAEQRCPAWEQPDGNGLETPGLDLIVAMRELYGSSLDQN